MEVTEHDARIEAQIAEKYFIKKTKSVKRQIAGIIIIGALLIAGMTVYVNWIYRQVSAITQPELIARYAQTYFKKKLPDVVSNKLEELMRRNIPVIMDELGQKGLAQVPAARRNIEKQLKFATDNMIASLTNQFSEMFDNIISSQKAELQAAIHEIKGKSDRQLKKEIEADTGRLMGILSREFEKETGASIKKTIASSVYSLQTINAELRRLKDTRHLSREDELKKELVMTMLKYIRIMEK